MRRRSVLPGFGLTLGVTLSYLGLVVLLPLAGLALKAAGLGWGGFWAEVTTPRVLAAFRVSFETALLAAIINAVFGLIIAWIMVRYRFPLQRLVDAVIDLPFALPTAVAGIASSTPIAKEPVACTSVAARTAPASIRPSIAPPLSARRPCRLGRFERASWRVSGRQRYHRTPRERRETSPACGEESAAGGS